MIEMRHIDDKTIICTVPKIGTVYLSKFSADYDHGLYAARPWHVTTFGRNFATVQECLDFLTEESNNFQEIEEVCSETDLRNARMIEHGYDAYAREEGYYD